MILDGDNLDNNDNDDDNEFEEPPPRWHGEVVLHLLPLFVQPASKKSNYPGRSDTSPFLVQLRNIFDHLSKEPNKSNRIHPSRKKGQDLVWFKNSDFIYYIWLNQAKT